MKPPRLKFPHISRFFSAASLWISLIALCTLNLALLGAVDPELSNRITGVLRHPFSSADHVSLAQTMRSLQQDARATQELLVAAELFAKDAAPADVLGATTDPISLLEEWEGQAERLARAYRFWRDIATEKPDWPDAQLMAATLAYQQSDMEEAGRLAQYTLSLDPNNNEAQQLLEILTK